MKQAREGKLTQEAATGAIVASSSDGIHRRQTLYEWRTDISRTTPVELSAMHGRNRVKSEWVVTELGVPFDPQRERATRTDDRRC